MTSLSDETPDAEQRMLGAIPGVAALGRGPAPDGGYSRHEYHHPAAGWGATQSGQPATKHLVVEVTPVLEQG
jgi:hypothetical protein